MGFHSLQIGKSALIAANYGLQVTGQNLSNVNTVGYSRQTLNQSGAAAGSRYGSSSLLGAGVSINAVSRVADSQAEKQLRQASSGYAHYSSLETAYSKIQAFFSEPDKAGLSNSLDSFWQAMSDLSTNIETTGKRTTTLEQAVTLATRFNDLSSQLRDYRQSMNDKVEDSVSQINSLLSTVSQLNKSIVSAESGGVTGVTANDLRDQRSDALRRLSELMDVEVLEESNGSCIVSTGGRSLVYFDQVYELGIKYEKSGDLRVSVPVFASDTYPITPGNGQLAAQMQIRDEVVKGYIDDIDQLAGSFTWEFNRLYSQGRSQQSLDSATSLNSVKDPAVTLDKLQWDANVPEGTFQIVNGNLQLIVHNRNTDKETTVNIEIDLDGQPGPNGEPDTILWDPANPTASNSLVNRMQKALNDAVPGAFTVGIDNEYKLSITSNSEDYGFCFGEDTSGVLAALGLNVFFTGHGAADIGVNQELLDDPSRMATSTSFSAGDNRNVLNLVAFSETGLARLGGKTPDEYYQDTAARLGSEALRVTTMSGVKSDLLSRMFNQREAISGVNEDEETVKLIAYQRAYQSAAKYISVVDEFYETLINM